MKLIQRMREELVRRNYAETTIRSYLHMMEEFRRYAHKRLDQLGADDVRKYQVHLLEERKLGVGTVAYRVAALRFFYAKTLKRPAMKEDLPCPHAPKHIRRVPTILTQEELSRLIDSAPNKANDNAGCTLSDNLMAHLRMAGIPSGTAGTRTKVRLQFSELTQSHAYPKQASMYADIKPYWRPRLCSRERCCGSNGRSSSGHISS